jgi:hypothetical protein
MKVDSYCTKRAMHTVIPDRTPYRITHGSDHSVGPVFIWGDRDETVGTRLVLYSRAEDWSLLPPPVATWERCGAEVSPMPA